MVRSEHMSYRKENDGFSLIELIIVIAIMAVLIAIIAPNLTKYLGSSKTQADKKNLDEVYAQTMNCISDAVTRVPEIPVMASEGGGATATYVLTYNSATGTATATAGANGVDAFADLLTYNLKSARTVSKKDKSKTSITIVISGTSLDGYEVSQSFTS